MSEENFIPGFQRGRAVVLSGDGTVLLTITAAGVEESTSPLAEHIRLTTAHITPFAGEALTEFARRLVASTGLPVVGWRFDLSADFPEEVEEQDDIVY